MLQFAHESLPLIKQLQNMAKKKDLGRPSGPQKEPLNIYMRSDRAKRLREFAVKEQKTISIVVENALEQQYGI